MKKKFLDKITNLTNENILGIKKYTKNAFWMFLSRFITAITSLIATFFISRKLGPINVGELNFSLSIVGIVSFISILGVDGVLVRELIKNPKNEKGLIDTSFIIRLLAGFISVVLLLTFAFFTKNSQTSKELIIILSFTHILSAFQIVQYIFIAKAESKINSIITISVVTVVNILKIVSVIFSPNVINIAIIMLIEQLLYASAYMSYYYIIFISGFSKIKININIGRNILSTGFYISLLTLFSFIYARVDQIMLNYFLGPKSVGLYDPAVKFSEIWNFLPGIIVSSLYPAIVNAKKISHKKYQTRILKIGLLVLSISVSIPVLLNIFSPLIIKTVYGYSFIESIPILRVYSWSCIGTFMSILVHQILLTEDKKLAMLVTGVVPMLANILLNILWIPKFGLIGAAYATVFSYNISPFIPLFFKSIRNSFKQNIKSYEN